MKKKKSPNDKAPRPVANPNVLGLRGETTEQPITDTLEQNYMPYAMSVIVSRAIPEIDGFKPSHRKLLYTMYKMGLLTGARTKSANIVGQTMKLNPHGDAAIYETMVRLSAGNQALLTPFVDSKGNFGKVYSRDMSYAASRYTEAKLSKICTALFEDIDKDAVDFVDNYDGTMQEPTLLPTAFPNVLVSANSGIAVGMASQICGFNLNEVCTAAIAILRDGDADLLSLMPAPDFPTGAEVIYDRAALENVYRTGRGSIQVRARWRYLPKENMIEITEIPYTATCEAILDKVAELIKAGKIREINDMRRTSPACAWPSTSSAARILTASCRSSSSPRPSRTPSPAILISSSRATPVSWACARSWTSGSPGGLSVSGAGSITSWRGRRTSSTCSRGSSGSFWTSTGPSRSSAIPSWRPTWCRT